ncbi:MAG: CoA ester lyase, partial [Clostridia bacterium]|nr:CoA ester lyase [Clostridia bacterium]
MRRSMLFLPGNTPNMLINGSRLGSDALIFDLEDAVSPAEKDSARVLVRNTLKYMDLGSCEIIVRINSIDTDYWKKDIDAILPYSPALILLPKTSCAQDALIADEYMTEVEQKLGLEQGKVKLMPLIETALGVENAFSIATATKRVAALFLGAEDLTADLRCKRTKGGAEINYARTRLVMAARAANIDVYDTPFTDVNDDEGIRVDAEYATALGFTGKASISPRHVEVINEVFSPSERDIAYAYEVMEAIRIAKEPGRGVISLHNKMIDAP